MNTIIPLGKTPTNSHPIIRDCGPGYFADWRFRVSEQYLITIAEALDRGVALNEILSAEQDSVVKELVLFQSGCESTMAESIKYALSCHNSRFKTPFARAISAMVIANRNPSQIGEELGCIPEHIEAYEKIFFDMRRYLDLRLVIKNLCYFPSSMTALGDDASRWLITAFERGWDGLAATFSKYDWYPRYDPIPVGKQIHDQVVLGTFGRVADFITTLEINGLPPSAAESELLLRVASVARSLEPNLTKLNYPTALSPNERKKRKETDEIVGGMSLAERRKVTNFFERLLSRAIGHELGPRSPIDSSPAVERAQ
jgi:hypothetical protein